MRGYRTYAERRADRHYAEVMAHVVGKAKVTLAALGLALLGVAGVGVVLALMYVAAKLGAGVCSF